MQEPSVGFGAIQRRRQPLSEIGHDSDTVGIEKTLVLEATVTGCHVDCP